MISDTIKEITKEAHQKLEKQVVLKIKKIESQKDYADLLKHFYAYFNAVEQAIAPFIPHVLHDYKERRNAAYIKSDIESLGATVSELPEAQAPQIKTDAEAIGALYVLEGSIMGGPYIVQMLRKKGIDRGFSFFSGYGDQSGKMWKAFQTVMNEVGASEEAGSQMMHKAAETFERFGNVFEKAKAENV